jgi:uncharacterized phage protein (TIGR02218 family)
MSKAISAQLKSHLAGEITTLALCWEIRRTDGTVHRFSSHDVDLISEGDTFSASAPMSATSLQVDRGLAVANMEATSAIGSNGITEEVLRARRLDHAEVDIFYVNWQDTSMGRLYLCKNWTIGNVRIDDYTWTAELRGLAQRLARSIVELYSITCRAQFGDSRCTIDLLETGSGRTQSGSVISVSSNKVFVASALDIPSGRDIYRYGKVRWTAPGSGDTWDGLNAGLVMEIKSFDYDLNQVTLFEAMPFDIDPGDEFEIVYGCDKLLSTCVFYGNELNFRGEPYILNAGDVPVTRDGSRQRHGWSR